MKDITISQLRGAVSTLGAAANRLAERILAEIEFAQALAEMEGKTAAWTKRISKARDAVAGVLLSARVSRLGNAVRQAEDILAPVGKAAKKYTIHCIGHAHIDMNWMWSWPETVAATNDTFITVLKLMEEFGDFCFTQSQASVYEIIRQYNPPLFEQIKRRVAEGRWEIAAVQWVEGDKNLVSGESLARHLLYTRRYMAEHFGLTPEDVPLDWEPDTFGHAHTIPTILSRGGVSRYYLCRGGRDEKPPVFWWQGPDGRKILVSHEHTWYIDHISPHNVKGMLSFCRSTGLKDWMLVYGVGDHGGGPTRRDLGLCGQMNSWPIFPNFRFNTTGKFYEILEANGDKLAVIDGELNFEFPGCYTSQSDIKKTNRLAEHQLERAETAAVLAWRALGTHYPGDELRKAWIDTIFGHFHDILPGSGVRATREYHSATFQNTAATTGMIKSNSLRAVAGAVDTSFAGGIEQAKVSPAGHSTAMGSGAGRQAHLGGISSAGHADSPSRGFVVFNPTAWQRNEVVQVSVWDSQEDNVQAGQFVVRTPDGKELPAQRIGQGDYWGHRYVDLAVPVSVEAMGYSAFAIDQTTQSTTTGICYPQSVPHITNVRDDGDVKTSVRYRNGEGLVFGQTAMENEFLAVKFDRCTGGIIKLTDKTTGRDLACGDNPAGLLEYVLERPGDMSAWVIHDPKKRICPMEVESFGSDKIGPHVASYVTKLKLNDSTISVTYSLARGRRRLDIDISANWLERGGPEVGTPTLRMQFPLALAGAKARYEIPYGSIERDLNSGQEVPALRWADVAGKLAGSNASAGCALLNDCKYGHSLDGSTLRVTLIRSSYEPDPLPELGSHEISLALVPHGKKLDVADLMRLGAGFNHPLQVVATDIHDGSLPTVSGAAVACKPAGVLITSIKKAEDEDAVILRLLETAGKASVATVALDKSLLGEVTEVVEVDLIERPTADSTAKPVAGGFTVQLPANGIASVKVNFAK